MLRQQHAQTSMSAMSAMRTLMKPLASVRQWIIIASRAELSSQFSLTVSPARLRVSQLSTGRWPVAHAAMRPYRGVGSWVPVCPSREHGGSRPRLRSSLWSVLRCKTIPPLRPPACPAPPLACSCRANLASKHTHMSMEAYPPDDPQISPPQGSQNFSAKVARVERLIARGRLCVL